MLQNPRLPRPLWMLLCLVAAACAAPPEPEPVQTPAPVFDPSVDVTPGFNDREPDTCKASGLQGYVGQPVSVVQSLALPGPVRVIAPGEMYDQEEYHSNRVDVRTDGAGTITSISCG